MEQLDIFTYPRAPGWKRAGTSKRAAEAMKPRAPTIREAALGLLRDTALTADEVAAKLDKSILAVRPRFSELLALGLIEDTGRTRKNASGISAVVWKAV